MSARVELIAMVAGTRAQDGLDGEPTETWREGSPTDEWQDQRHDFDSLDAAKDFVRSLDPRVSTHVVIYATDDEGTEHEVFVKDRGDDLDAAHVPTAAEIAAAEAAEAPAEPPPTPMARQ